MPSRILAWSLCWQHRPLLPARLRQLRRGIGRQAYSGNHREQQCNRMEFGQSWEWGRPGSHVTTARTGSDWAAVSMDDPASWDNGEAPNAIAEATDPHAEPFSQGTDSAEVLPNPDQAASSSSQGMDALQVPNSNHAVTLPLEDMPWGFMMRPADSMHSACMHHHPLRLRGSSFPLAFLLQVSELLDGRRGSLDLAQIERVFPFPLDKFQAQAVDILLQGDSVVVSAPTGAGKTAIAEAAICAVLAR